ncbi:unnamed protein product [Chrysoparadoxa australica]
MPSNVNVAAAVDKVLREAPVSPSAQALWRPFLMSETFTRLATDSFWWVVGHHIQGTPFNARNSSVFARMSCSYTRLFTKVPTQYKDAFFSTFYEAWGLMLLICLQAAYPKSREAFEAPAFRIGLLDLCSEWTLGMKRLLPVEGHWIQSFGHRPPTEMEALKTRSFGNGLGRDKRVETAPLEVHGDVRQSHGGVSRTEFGHSPLVQQYLSLCGIQVRPRLPVALRLATQSSQSSRPFQDQLKLTARSASESSLSIGGSKTVTSRRPGTSTGGWGLCPPRPSTSEVLRQVYQRREELMSGHEQSKMDMWRDVHESRRECLGERAKIRRQATLILNGAGDLHDLSNHIAAKRLDEKQHVRGRRDE